MRRLGYLLAGCFLVLAVGILPAADPESGETRNKISASTTFESFDDDTDSWKELTLDYRRSTRYGSIIGRVNLAQRFDDEGSQFEIDAYPRLRKKTYAYLNVGVSSTDLFPELRYGAEIYHNFPHGYETSIGFRQLEFDTSDVTIYTGTLAKYVGNYWISWRPNYVSKDDGSSYSNGLSVRRYFGGRYEYAEVSVGGGTSNEDGVVTDFDDRLDSFRARAELRRRITPQVIVKGQVGYRDQDFEFDRKRQSFVFGLGIERHF